MPPPRVSVICAFYNGERFLEESIESVLAQSYPDFELLLVDDGSRDGSSETALDFARKNSSKIRYLEHDGHANRGISATRNLGLEMARGEFVAFIDSDDIWRPNKLREQVAILDHFSAAAMVCGAVNYWSSWAGGKDRVVPTGRIVDGLSWPPQTILDLYPLGHCAAPCPSDVMVRRAVCQSVGAFEERFEGLYEDQAFFAKLYLVAPVYFAPNVWLDYRQHEDSCVAVVRREGFYRQTRRGFLAWLKDYVVMHPGGDSQRISESIARAMWEIDHPVIGRISRKMRSILFRVRQFAPSGTSRS